MRRLYHAFSAADTLLHTPSDAAAPVMTFCTTCASSWAELSAPAGVHTWPGQQEDWSLPDTKHTSFCTQANTATRMQQWESGRA